MPIGGFEGPSGRGVRSVERALSASTLLPTLAFAALGAVTVLLVAQMGISPLGAVIGQSARDGGHAVTTPRMSISDGPPRLHRPAPARDRETTRVGDPPTVITAALPVHVQADLMTKVAFVALPGSAAEGSAEPASQRAPETAEHAAEHAAKATAKATEHAKADKTSHPVKATQSL